MCYSVQVAASVKKLRRHFPLEIDYTRTERLFEARLEDPSIRIARAFEDNFATPENDAELRIKALIDAHRERLQTQLERELFSTKKRLADAERKLKAKVTKTAENEARIASNKIEDLTRRLADLHLAELKARDERIFPKQYTGVIIHEEGRKILTPMRYLCRPEEKPAFYDEKFPGLYNARRDNLERFWANLFGRRHAVVLLESFFENVKRHDMEGRPLAPGEKPENVVLQFSPEPASPMWVACLWSHWAHPDEGELRSFAIITDEPPPEVAAAGTTAVRSRCSPSMSTRGSSPGSTLVRSSRPCWMIGRGFVSSIASFAPLERRATAPHHSRSSRPFRSPFEPDVPTLLEASKTTAQRRVLAVSQNQRGENDVILLALLVVIALAGALMFVGEKLGGAVGEKLRAASIFCFLVGIPLVLLIFRGDSGGGLDSELLWRGPR